MSIDRLERMEKRLIRVEELLKKMVEQKPSEQSKRISEKEAMTIYDVSQHVLRRLRLGYKRSDGVEIEPALFKWGNRNGRNFDYDREELDRVLQRTIINS